MKGQAAAIRPTVPTAAVVVYKKLRRVGAGDPRTPVGVAKFINNLACYAGPILILAGAVASRLLKISGVCGRTGGGGVCARRCSAAAGAKASAARLRVDQYVSHRSVSACPGMDDISLMFLACPSISNFDLPLLS